MAAANRETSGRDINFYFKVGEHTAANVDWDALTTGTGLATTTNLLSGVTTLSEFGSTEAGEVVVGFFGEQFKRKFRTQSTPVNFTMTITLDWSNPTHASIANPTNSGTDCTAAGLIATGSDGTIAVVNGFILTQNFTYDNDNVTMVEVGVSTTSAPIVVHNV